MTCMNDVKKIISALISKNKIDFCHDDWSANYRQDWDEELSKDLRLAFGDVEKLIAGVENNDDVLSLGALTMARIRFLMLSDHFLNIHEDLEKMLVIYRDKNIEIPEDYKY
ncbi:hypothetical protein ALP01_200363 [Pseudomonas caricapapayae]|nr:hypothetical protein ALP01_200363 [Pseudomonas caricapapayae]